MTQSSLQTTCAYCGVGCGVSLPRTNDRTIKVKGDSTHPANKGRLCVKGTHLGDVLPLRNRLLFPQINNERVSWDHASQHIADKIRNAQTVHGNDSFAFYLSGQLLTEDYYAANKLAKGFLGTANVDTNSRLCMSSAVAAHTRAFGEDAPPSTYEDLELAELTILTGSNLAWAHPVLFQRMQQARKENASKKLVVIDPRESASAKEADLHLAIKPGTDGQLFNALLVYLADHNSVDHTYVGQHVNHFDETLQSARADVGNDITNQAQQVGLPVEQLLAFFELFAKTPKTTTVWSMGINQSASGVDKGNAIINAHLATGRIGKPGASAFSITGQPNAMGGREVGGLANQLATHRLFDTESIQAVESFWNAPNIATKPGYKAVDLFDACLAGKIKVLWIMGTNPVASMPNSNKIIEALKNVETVIVSDVVNDNDTLTYADIKLPALAWGEKDGTVTNSERTISRQRAYLMPPGQSRADWAAVKAVAAQLGFKEAFDWHHAHEVFVEHARLSKINDGTHLQFTLSDVADLSFRDYQDWQPKQWPLNGTDSQRLFSDGRFSTPTGKANMVPLQPTSPEIPADDQFMLNTGRLRDQWHTMSRTGLAKTLNKHTSQLELQMNPQDAERLKLSNNGLVKISSAVGAFYAHLKVSKSQSLGQVFAPMHWNEFFANQGGVAKTIESVTDPISGQPAFKHSHVRVEPAMSFFSGFLFIQDELYKPEWLNQTIHFKTYTNSGVLFRFYHSTLSLSEFTLAESFPYTHSMISKEHDSAFWADGNEKGLTFWLSVSENELANPDLDYLDFATSTDFSHLSPAELAVGVSEDMAGIGNVVCTCFSVTDRQIQQFFAQNPEADVAELQTALKCGTNCGSCLTEVKDMAKSLSQECEFEDAMAS